MTCHICKKEYKRLIQHLKTVHKTNELIIEPTNLKQFLVMYRLTPWTQKEERIIKRYKEAIKNFINDGKDLPIDLYKILKRRYASYSRKSGMKLMYRIASKIPRNS